MEQRQAGAGDEHANTTYITGGFLPGVFQCDDGKDGPPVHAPHAGTIAHVVVMDGGTVRANLGWTQDPVKPLPIPAQGAGSRQEGL